MRSRAESFAQYHDEHARYGGASQEFHALAATFLRSLAEQYDEACGDNVELKCQLVDAASDTARLRCRAENAERERDVCAAELADRYDAKQAVANAEAERDAAQPWRRRRGPPMASPAVWKEGRVVARMIQIGDDAAIVQTLQSFGDSAESWEVTSTIVEEDDTSHAETGRARGLREAKRLADRHVDELWKTWAAENGAEW